MHFKYPSKWLQCRLIVTWLKQMKLLLSQHKFWVHTIQLCTSLRCHFIWSHNCRMHVCLAVTCQLHFWQNDWDLLCATAETWGWNGYQTKSQHKKLTLKNILPPLLPRHKSKNFQSLVHHSTTEPFLIPIIVTHEYKLLYHQLYHDVHQWYRLVISVMWIIHLLLLTTTLCYTAPYQATPQYHTIPHHTHSPCALPLTLRGSRPVSLSLTYCTAVCPLLAALHHLQMWMPGVHLLHPVLLYLKDLWDNPDFTFIHTNTTGLFCTCMLTPIQQL